MTTETDLQRTPRRKTDASKLDRLPPSSVEAEQGVLGCVLLTPKDCMAECLEKLKVGPEVFYDIRHQTLFGVLTEMYDNAEGIDLTTVMQRLKDRQQLDGVGGLAYLASLPDSVPTAAGLDYYLDIVLDKYLLRKMVQTCTSIVGRVFEFPGGSVMEFIDEVERDIMAVSSARDTHSTPPIRELVNQAIADLEKAFQNKGQPTGIVSGFPDLDWLTGGFQDGEMIVIAARPSVGKTSLAMNIAGNVSCESKLPVGVFSLEMTGKQLAKRMLLSRASVNVRSANAGDLGGQDFPKLTAMAGRLSNAPIYIDDSSGISILQLRAKARRMQQQHGIRLVVVDYMQLLHSTSRKADNRQQEMADISGGIKAMAKELNLPVIALSQLNRDLEKRKGDRPRLCDLRESGAIEQDADFVGMLYKANTSGAGDEVENEEPMAIPVNMGVEKQRNGPTGIVEFTFLKQYTRFESAAKVTMDDIPSDAQ